MYVCFDPTVLGSVGITQPGPMDSGLHALSTLLSNNNNTLPLPFFPSFSFMLSSNMNVVLFG